MSDPSVPLPAVLLGSFYLLQLGSCLWATNLGEALFDSQKTSLCLVTFLLTYALLRKDYTKALKHYCMAAVMYLSLLLVFLIPQLYELISIGFDRHSVMRLYAFSGNKNMLAALILLLLLWTPWLWSQTQSKPLKVLLLALVGCYLFVLYQLETRSVYLAGGFVLLLLLFYGLRKRMGRSLAWMILLPIFGWIWLLGISMFDGLTQIDQKWDIMTPGSSTGTLHQRSVVWSKSMELFAQRPVLGVGAGNWKIHFPGVGMEGLKAAETNAVFFNRPHNDFIQVLTEQGILGWMCYLGLFAVLVVAFFNRVKRQPLETPLALWLSYASLIAFMWFSLFSFPKERIEFQVLLGILLAISTYQLRSELQSISLKGVRGTSITPWLMIGIVGFNLYLGGVRILQGQKAFVLEQAYANHQLSSAPYTTNSSAHPLKSITAYGTPMAFFGAMQAWEVQDYRGTISNLTQAIEVHPGHLSSHTNLGAAYSRLGEVDLALQSFENALQIVDTHADTLYNIALIYFHQGRWEQAQSYALRLPDSDPRKRMLLENLQQN